MVYIQVLPTCLETPPSCDVVSEQQKSFFFFFGVSGLEEKQTQKNAIGSWAQKGCIKQKKKAYKMSLSLSLLGHLLGHIRYRAKFDLKYKALS